MWFLCCVIPRSGCRVELKQPMIHLFDHHPWMEMTAMSMLSETAERPYFFRKVIRKPKPMKIITCTSWNTGEGRRDLQDRQGILQSS